MSMIQIWTKTALLPTSRLARRPYLAQLGAALVPLAFVAVTSSMVMGLAVRAPFFGLFGAGRFFSGIFVVSVCAATWIVFCSMANRLRDMGRNGAWALTPGAVFVVLCWLFSIGDPRAFAFIFFIYGMFFFPVICAAFALFLAIFPSKPLPAVGDSGTLALEANEPSPTGAGVTIADVAFQTNRRLSRDGFVKTWLATNAVSFVYFLTATTLFIPLMRFLDLRQPHIIVAALIAAAPILWTQACLLANRLHDLGYSAPWILAPGAIYLFACAVVTIDDLHGFDDMAVNATGVLAFLYLVFGLWLALTPGKKEANRFGPPTDLRLT